MNYLRKIADGENLNIEEAEEAVVDVFEEATDTQIGAVLTGLRVKGETEEEIAGFARGMKKKARSISPNVEKVMDIVGTGGDNYNTINVSTASSVVAASTGVNIAKHGNYSVSSKSGSADVLKELGVKIGAEPEEVKKSVEEIGLGFMLAPVFHPSMERVIKPRQELGIRTVFNILGPLTNPANANPLLVGVYSESLVPVIGRVLNLMDKKALVVHGSGMDEIALHGKTKIAEVKENKVEEFTIEPSDIGLSKYPAKEIEGGSPKENARLLKEVFKGKEGAKLDIVLANTGAALYIYGEAESIAEGVEKARESIERGEALKKLDQLRNIQ